MLRRRVARDTTPTIPRWKSVHRQNRPQSPHVAISNVGRVREAGTIESTTVGFLIRYFKWRRNQKASRGCTLEIGDSRIRQIKNDEIPVLNINTQTFRTACSVRLELYKKENGRLQYSTSGILPVLTKGLQTSRGKLKVGSCYTNFARVYCSYNSRQRVTPCSTDSWKTENVIYVQC